MIRKAADLYQEALILSVLTATFACGAPGGWLNLPGLFIDWFRTNPGTTFAGR